MKQKKLEIILQQRVKPFAKPKIQLEQYHTPPHIAAAVVHCMYEQGEVEDLTVCDLGCGTGMLGIACSLMGAEKVVGVELDKDAIAVLEANLEEFDEDDEIEVEVVNQNVNEYTEPCDVVVMNPPFGTREKGADMNFLVAASKIGKVVYSMHKSTTRKHVEKTGKACGLIGKPIAELRYNLDATHDFHKKKSVDIRVDLWRFEKEEGK